MRQLNREKNRKNSFSQLNITVARARDECFNIFEVVDLLSWKPNETFQMMTRGDTMVSVLPLLPHGAELERVASGCIWSEGPAWVPDIQALRWSDIPNNRIMQFHPETGTTSVYRDQTGFANGRTTDNNGVVIQCSHGKRAIEGDDGTRIFSIAESWFGGRFNSPNDVVVRSDGSIWFTDPPYGITVEGEGVPGEREYGDNFVFRIDARDHSVSVAVTDIEEPNGLAFSPDESILYISDTSAGRRDDGTGNRHVRAYDVIDERSCKNGRTVFSYESGLPDGFRVDHEGHLWSSSESGVRVFTADGTPVGVINVPEIVSNLCFGGSEGTDLYITATTSLYRIPTLVTDASALWRRK